jgi:hypothetical protein
MAARKCINNFSAPSNANIGTAPEMNVGDGNIELKPAIINMVQQSPFCRKASEDANAHLQHYLEICSTFIIRGITQDVVSLCLFPFSLLGKAKQWTTPTRKLCPPGRSSPMHFSPSSFCWVRPIPSGTRSQAFNSLWMKTLLRCGSNCRIISLHAHTMEWNSGSSSRAYIMC